MMSMAFEASLPVSCVVIKGEGSVHIAIFTSENEADLMRSWSFALLRRCPDCVKLLRLQETPVWVVPS